MKYAINFRIEIHSTYLVWSTNGQENCSKAEEYYKKSIAVCSDYNWFVYFLLCQVYLDKHKTHFKYDRKMSGNLEELKKAKVCKYMREWKESIRYLHTVLCSHECDRQHEL